MEKLLPQKKTIIFIALAILFIVGAISVRLAVDQMQAYGQAQESVKAGDGRLAVMYLDRVLNAHIPFSPLERRAREQLLALAAQHEAQGDTAFALVCLETIRTSRYLARHVFIPDGGEIPALNNRIAAIKVRLLAKDGLAADVRSGHQQQMDILEKDFSPALFWSLVAVAAFWAYVVALALWVLWRRKGHIALSGLSFFIWIASLYLA